MFRNSFSYLLSIYSYLTFFDFAGNIFLFYVKSYKYLLLYWERKKKKKKEAVYPIHFQVFTRFAPLHLSSPSSSSSSSPLSPINSHLPSLIFRSPIFLSPLIYFVNKMNKIY
uniref:Uncharacterized protein n=1 Tax=Strigamia maritima TaxID=126957 RepID=T1JGM4_STRMM